MTSMKRSPSDGALSLQTESAAPSHAHGVQFYGEDAGLIDGMGKFLGYAIEEGGSAVVVATAPHREALAARLEERGIDTESVIAEGRVVLLDASETLSKFVFEGWPDPARFTEIIGEALTRAQNASHSTNARLAVFGEMVALLWAQGKYDTAIRLEQLWNQLGRTHSFFLRCAYPMKSFNGEELGQQFLKICAVHSHVIPSESYTALTSEDERMRNVSHLQQRAQALEVETLERKEAQKALKRREADLADLLENALEGVQRTGPDQRVMWANKALLKLLGYSTEEYIGHPMSDFFVERKVFEDFWARLMRREEIYNFSAELRCKSGTVAHVVINSNGLWEDGQFVHTRTFIHDMTERRTMEVALKLAHDELEKRVSERTDELRRKNIQVLKQAEILDMTNQGLRELSARLLKVQDEERRRIARDLHDSTGQTLALLSMNLSVLENEASRSNPELAKGLLQNVEIVRKISAEIRTLSYLLHPPLLEEMGLESALRWYIEGFDQRSHIKVSLELSPDLGRLSRDMEIAIFRVLQECLTNIHRHSESPTASIRVTRSPKGVVLEVRDEGKGIPADKLAKIASGGDSGVGLRGMRERVQGLGGTLQIDSNQGGTQIRVAIPVGATAAEA
jgi:PAS domain S-box-containing protein